MSAAFAEVVVVGAACIDVKGRVAGNALRGTSNAGQVRISAGGCARNIAENLARFGVSTALLSAVSADEFGRALLAQTARAGVNIDHVQIAETTPSAAYVALINQNGQLTLGIDDLAIVQHLSCAYIEDHATMLTNARMVMIDANVPLASAERVLDVCGAAGVPVGLDPVAYAPAQRFRSLIGSFSLVTPNIVEARALTGCAVRDVRGALTAAKHLIAAGVETAIITLADEGLVYATAETTGHIPAVQVEVLDPTGASDALTATVVYGMLHGISTDEAVRLGVSAAALTIGSLDTVRQDLSLESLYAQLVL